MTVPKCRDCGKPMRATHRVIERKATEVELKAHRENERWITMQRKHLNGKYERDELSTAEYERLGARIERQALARWRSQYPRLRVFGADGTAWEEPFDGHYGYEGNDLFCSLRCGYRWALRNIKKQDGAAKVLAAGK